MLADYEVAMDCGSLQTAFSEVGSEEIDKCKIKLAFQKMGRIRWENAPQNYKDSLVNAVEECVVKLQGASTSSLVDADF